MYVIHSHKGSAIGPHSNQGTCGLLQTSAGIGYTAQTRNIPSLGFTSWYPAKHVGLRSPGPQYIGVRHNFQNLGSCGCAEVQRMRSDTRMIGGRNPESIDPGKWFKLPGSPLHVKWLNLILIKTMQANNGKPHWQCYLDLLGNARLPPFLMRRKVQACAKLQATSLCNLIQVMQAKHINWASGSLGGKADVLDWMCRNLSRSLQINKLTCQGRDRERDPVRAYRGPHRLGEGSILGDEPFTRRLIVFCSHRVADVRPLQLLCHLDDRKQIWKAMQSEMNTSSEELHGLASIIGNISGRQRLTCEWLTATKTHCQVERTALNIIWPVLYKYRK
jgi:hypothetical protein